MKHVDLWLTLDMERSQDQAIVRVPRLDNWRRIIVRLRVGDAPYQLPAGAAAAWSLDRFGEGVPLNEIAATVSTMEVESGETEKVIVLQWDAAWTQISGAFRAIIHIVGSDQEDLWTPTFQFIVTESPYDDATVRQSPQFTALSGMKAVLDAKLEDLNEVFDETTGAVARAEAAVTAAEAAQSAAEASASSAQSAATDASTAQSAAEASASSAQSAAAEASSSKGQAQTARAGAEAAEDNAEAWAVGTKNGQTVSSTDPTYHNNAKYYADNVAEFIAGYTASHDDLTDRDAANQHPISAITGLEDALEDITDLIPAQAAAGNQLADKDFVNSSINNIAAFYITKDASGNPFATKAQLTAASTFYSGGSVRVPTRNDYCIVLSDESQTTQAGENQTTRYMYDGGWQFQYVVNNTALTAAQLAAVNSGITAALRGAYDTHLENSGIHVTAAQKQAWNGHIDDGDIHVTAQDKDNWDGKQDAAPTITISYTQIVSADPMIIQLTDAQAAIMDDPDVIAVNFDVSQIDLGVITINKVDGTGDGWSFCGTANVPYYHFTDSQSISGIDYVSCYAYAYSSFDKRIMLANGESVNFVDPFAHMSDIQSGGDSSDKIDKGTKKVFPQRTIQSGKINGSGEHQSDKYYRQMDAAVEPGKTYYVSGTGYNTTQPLIVMFNESGSVIGKAGWPTPAAFHAYTDYEFTAPANCVRISVNSHVMGYDGFAHPSIWYIGEDDMDGDDIREELAQKATMIGQWVKADYTYETSKNYGITTGVAVANTSSTAASYCCAKIAYDQSKRYRVYGESRASHLPVLLCVDEYDNVIAKFGAWESGDYIVVKEMEYQIPDDTKFLIVNSLKLTQDARIEVYVERDVTSFEAGKVGVFFGDSITQGNRVYITTDVPPYKDFPTVVGKMLGCTVYNGGLGGTTWAGNTSVDCKNVIDCVVSGNFTSVISGISQYGVNASAIVRYNEIAELDFDKVDFVCFAFGTNDWNSGYSAAAVKSAMAYCISTLLGEYPHLRVYVTTPIYRWRLGSDNDQDSDTYVNTTSGLKLRDMCEAIIEGAHEAKVPCKNMYDESGISQYTREMYFGKISTSEYDGTHLNEDGYWLMGEEIAKFINSSVGSSETGEAKGKMTIGGTEYDIRVSTTDAGAAGYVTFVVEE